MWSDRLALARLDQARRQLSCDEAGISKAPGHLPLVIRNGRTAMRVSLLALALAVTGPAFAGDVTKATNAADCEKAGGMWDASTNKCSEKKKSY